MVGCNCIRPASSIYIWAAVYFILWYIAVFERLPVKLLSFNPLQAAFAMKKSLFLPKFVNGYFDCAIYRWSLLEQLEARIHIFWGGIKWESKLFIIAVIEHFLDGNVHQALEKTFCSSIVCQSNNGVHSIIVHHEDSYALQWDYLKCDGKLQAADKVEKLLGWPNEIETLLKALSMKKFEKHCRWCLWVL